MLGALFFYRTALSFAYVGKKLYLCSRKGYGLIKRKNMSAIRSILLDAFCPNTCAQCGKYIADEEGGQEICDQCIQRLPRTEQGQLRQNETEMTLAGPTSDIVRTMKSMHLNRAAAYLFYEKNHPVQGLVYKMKYKDRPGVGYCLGKQAAMEMMYAGFWDDIVVIVPIPLHVRRMRERGYNQSEYIARGISEVTGIPVDTTHVVRLRHTPQQAKLKASGDARKANVEGAFAVNHPEQLYHQHILLVDDLVTTGETMRSCLKAMKTIRGVTCSVFALCKAR